MRKIDKALKNRLINGDLKSLLDYIKSDNELRLKVRRGRDAFVYYRKGKALEIKTLKVDPKYGIVPSTDLAITNSKKYFKLIKESIDTWINKNKQRREFDTQQNIAKCNQSSNDKDLILDMEYSFKIALQEP